MPMSHRVVIAVFPDVDLLDVTGPAEVFALANRETAGRAGYGVSLAGPVAGAAVPLPYTGRPAGPTPVPRQVREAEYLAVLTWFGEPSSTAVAADSSGRRTAAGRR